MLSNLPTQTLFPMPIDIANRFEKLQQEFTWGSIGDEFKFHLVNWHNVCAPLQKGGLRNRKSLVFLSSFTQKMVVVLCNNEE
jgi:hypothetical protein